MARTRIKICCIQNAGEVRLAVRYGADALGLVAAMPSGPGPIPEEEIAGIVPLVPPAVSSFLLTSEREADAIVNQQQRTGASTLQLVDAVTPEVRRELKRRLPGVKLVQVIHVTGESALEAAREAAETSDGILLDSGSPDAEVRVLGGTGRTHDWPLSRRIREAIDLPLFLAGGLRPENVAEAIRQVQPYAVDVCTGVRDDYRLDEGKLNAFVNAVRSQD